MPCGPGWETYGFCDKKAGGGREEGRRGQNRRGPVHWGRPWGSCQEPKTRQGRDNFQGVDSESCEDWRSCWGEAVQQTFPGAGPIRSPEGCWPVLCNLWAVDRASPMEMVFSGGRWTSLQTARHRGATRLRESVWYGAMLNREGPLLRKAVPMPGSACKNVLVLSPFLDPTLSLAPLHSPSLCVVASLREPPVLASPAKLTLLPPAGGSNSAVSELQWSTYFVIARWSGVDSLKCRWLGPAPQLSVGRSGWGLRACMSSLQGLAATAGWGPPFQNHSDVVPGPGIHIIWELLTKVQSWDIPRTPKSEFPRDP